MKVKSSTVLVGGLGLLLFASLALAHHSVEKSYDTAQPVFLQGVVRQTAWANPHAYILISVLNSNGVEETWAVELGAPNSLMRAGLEKTALTPGDEITLTGFGPKPGVTAEGPQIFGTEPPELAAVLTAVAERAIANRLVHSSEITLPDGRKLASATGEFWK